MFSKINVKIFIMFFFICINTGAYATQFATPSTLEKETMCSINEPTLGEKIHRNEAAQIAKALSLLSNGQVMSEKQLFIVPSEVLSLVVSNDVIFIDVRNAKHFQQYFIPQSMNYSTYLIKAKSYLRSKKIVLVDEGFREAYLLELQKTLADEGFSQVKILRGGLYGWKQAGGELTGSNPNANDLNHIKPFELLKLKMYQHWVVVELGTLNSDKYKTKTAKLAYLDSIKLSDEKNMVITTNDGNGYAQIEKLAKELGLRISIFSKAAQMLTKPC